MILDVCCGSKMFWFNKHHKNTIYMDIRDEEYDVYDKHIAVHPDVIADLEVSRSKIVVLIWLSSILLI